MEAIPSEMRGISHAKAKRRKAQYSDLRAFVPLRELKMRLKKDRSDVDMGRNWQTCII